MDTLDRQLLSLLTTKIPLGPRPYGIIAESVGTDEAEVLLRICRLKESGVIRSVQAFFDSLRLGYRSTMIAMKVPDQEMRAAETSLQDHPGVRSVAVRTHVFNLWFWLILPHDEDIESHARILHELCGSETTLLLPTLKDYKRSSQEWSETPDFENVSSTLEPPLPIEECHLISDAETACIRQLQEDFPLTDRPFAKMAQEMGLNQQEFLLTVEQIRRKGYFLGIRAILAKEESPPQQTLVVWNIPAEKRNPIGVRLALFDTIKTCCERPAYAEFPYSIYTSIGPKKSEEIKSVMQQIYRDIGEWPSLDIFPLKVLKKEKVKLFSPELENWCRHVGLVRTNQTKKTSKEWRPIVGRQLLSKAGGIHQ